LKKLLVFVPLCLLILFSCQHTKRLVLKRNWDDYKKAYAWLSRQNDSAFYYFNKVVSSSRDSLQIAMAYNNMAVIQSDAGDDFGAQESLSLSLKFLDEKDARDRSCLANDYNELGVTSFNLKNQDAAIAFYDQAIRFTDDSLRIPVILNNKANAYQQKKDYPRALKLYSSVIRQTGTNDAGYARILTNMATTKWLADPRYHAAPELLKALNIRTQEKDLWGQNSSFAHLADYYFPSQPDSALFYARAMFDVARRLNSPDDQLEALEKLVRVAAPADVRQYFTRYRHLGDSVQAARKAAKSQFALIRYGVEKNKADNLRLQKDNTEKKYQLFKQGVLLYSSLFLLTAGSVFAAWWYRKRKRRLERQVQEKIRENQLRTSKKVHDVVANGLYRMMSEIENQGDLDKEHLLDRIEEMYEKSRDISYDEPWLSGQDFPALVSALLSSFATDQVRVALVGNTEALWKAVSLTVRQELYYILQELMVNMKKHSRAANVAILFERHDHRIRIHYGDDGVGIPKNAPHKNGLNNTGNRIKVIRGSIIFDNNAGKGLGIQIAFPTA
jgi:tetratricopeptide (TPR) repeat protein/two-component sensor histidine kinase